MGRGAAGTKWMANEELRGITYAFNEPSEMVFTKLGELIGKSMTERGKIDAEAIYKELSNDPYKHSGEIIRTLLSNPASVKIVYDFYKMQNDDAKMETRLSKSTNDFIFGYTEDSMVKIGVEDIMHELPDCDPKDTREQADMVTLPNGAKIPRKQYEEEYMIEQQGRVENANKGISVQEAKKGILDAKITESKKQQQMSDIQKRQKAKILWNRNQQNGLSLEEQRILEENERQRNLATVAYRNMQDDKRKKNNGIEM